MRGKCNIKNSLILIKKFILLNMINGVQLVTIITTWMLKVILFLSLNIAMYMK